MQDDINEFLKAVNEGDGEAIAHLAEVGRQFLCGDGVDKNEPLGLKFLKLSSEKGSPWGHLGLGMAYLYGTGIRKNTKKAEGHLKKAAEHNITEAFSQLGMLYIIKKNSTSALEYLDKASERGHLGAKFKLYAIYCGLTPLKIEHNIPKALDFLKCSAEKGFLDAQYTLGLLNFRGEYLSQDYGEAAKWWSEAAKGGNPLAELSYGVLCLIGEGVPQNKTIAKKWLVLAEEHGIDVAGKILKANFPESISIKTCKEIIAKLKISPSPN